MNQPLDLLAAVRIQEINELRQRVVDMQKQYHDLQQNFMRFMYCVVKQSGTPNDHGGAYVVERLTVAQIPQSFQIGQGEDENGNTVVAVQEAPRIIV